MVKVIEEQSENKQNKNFKPLFISLASFALALIIVIATVLVMFVNKFKPNKSDVNVFSRGLVAVSSDGGWGYVDINGKMAITPQFEKAYAFSDNGLALVKLDGYYGFINTKGRYVINPIYQEAYSFDFGDELTVVKRNQKYGYVDDEGDEEIACQFEAAYPFEYDLALVKISGRYGFIDDDGHFIINPTYEYADSFTRSGIAIVGHNTENGKRWACINRRGELLTEYAYHVIEIKNNYVIAYDGTKYTVFNSKMKPIFSTELTIYAQGQFDPFENINEGLIPFRDENHKFGYMNLKGKIVIPAEYDILGNFYDGLALFRKDGKYGYINKKNKIVIENKFKFAERFSEGYAVISDNGEYGLINTKGEVVIKAKYSSLGMVKNGVCYFAKADKSGFGYIDLKEREIISQQCSEIPSYSDNVYSCSDDGYIVIKQNEFYGIINKKGQFVVNSYLKEIDFNKKMLTNNIV